MKGIADCQLPIADLKQVTGNTKKSAIGNRQ
jgi:hypothetical protein